MECVYSAIVKCEVPQASSLLTTPTGLQSPTKDPDALNSDTELYTPQNTPTASTSMTRSSSSNSETPSYANEDQCVYYGHYVDDVWHQNGEKPKRPLVSPNKRSSNSSRQTEETSQMAHKATQMVTTDGYPFKRPRQTRTETPKASKRRRLNPLADSHEAKLDDADLSSRTKSSEVENIEGVSVASDGSLLFLINWKRTWVSSSTLSEDVRKQAEDFLEQVKKKPRFHL